VSRPRLARHRDLAARLLLAAGVFGEWRILPAPRDRGQESYCEKDPWEVHDFTHTRWSHGRSDRSLSVGHCRATV